MAQRFLRRTGEEFLGSFWRPSESPANFKAARLTAYFFTSFAFLAYRASWDFLAIKNKRPSGLHLMYHSAPPPSNNEGAAEESPCRARSIYTQIKLTRSAAHRYLCNP